GNNLVSAGANAINNQRQRTDSLPPVTAAVVQQNNIAAALIVWRARWQVCQHIGRNLLGRAMRILPPIAWINLVADRSVPHVLRNFERPHLIFSVRLLINGIRRPEKNGSHPQTAGKQPLRQIQLQLHKAMRDIADIRMSEGVIADLVALAVNSLREIRKFIGLDSD